jgi:hypothetical protein
MIGGSAAMPGHDIGPRAITVHVHPKPPIVQKILERLSRNLEMTSSQLAAIKYGV